MKCFNRMLFFTSLVFLLSVPEIVYAYPYTISGVVCDNGTGAPVEGANVQITELNTGTITDKTGAFTIENIPDGEFNIRVTLIGYAPASKKLRMPGTDTLEILLTASPFIMEEVVSTARGRQTKLTDIPGSVEVINDTDFHEMNPVNIPEVLSHKPGLAVSSAMPWSSCVVIRGLTKDHVILLVDGCRVSTNTTHPAQFGTIAGGDIERIEVLKGPLSVLYGSGSTGGVVNVITRKGHFSRNPGVGFSLNPTYESAANGLSIYERTTFSSSCFYANISQSNRKYTDYRAAGNERISNSQFEDRQTQVNFGIRLSARHVIEGRYQTFSVLNAGIPGSNSFPTNALASYPTTSRKLIDTIWTWRPDYTWWSESRVNAYYQPVERNVRLLPRVVTTVEGKPDPTKTLRVTALDFHPVADHYMHGMRWQNVLSFGNHEVVAGIEGWQKHMVSDRVKNMKKEIIVTETGAIANTLYETVKDTPVPESTQRPVGIFAEDNFPLTNRMKITLGGRIDRIHTENEKAYMTYDPPSDKLLWDARTDDDTSWSFVGGMVYNIFDFMDLNLTLARSFRSPTIEERYLYAELGKLTVGDPELDSEKGSFAEGGVSVRLGPVKLEGHAFVNSITDMVILNPGGSFNGQPADVYENAGRAILTGGEARADCIVLPRMLLSGDVSYTHGKDEVYNTNLPSIPPVKAHLAARWDAGKGLWIQPLLTMTGKQDRVANGERKTPGYGILDISLGKTVTRTGKVNHDIVLGVKNLTDKLYRDHLTESRGYEMYGMGRSFYLSWQINSEN